MHLLADLLLIHLEREKTIVSDVEKSRERVGTRQARTSFSAIFLNDEDDGAKQCQRMNGWAGEGKNICRRGDEQSLIN